MTQWKDDRHVQHPLTKKILQPETVHIWEEEGNEKPPRKNNFPRKKLRALCLVHVTLEVEYATQPSP